MKYLPILYICITSLFSLVLHAEPQEVKLLTYNVYFDDKSGAERYSHIITLIKQGNYNLIALQECTPAFLSLLLQDKVLSTFTRIQGNPAHGYSNIILSTLPLSAMGDIDIPSSMGRSAPYVVIKGSDTLLVNVHLESGLFDRNVRAQQIKHILSSGVENQNMVLLGDFNFGNGANEEQLLWEFTDLGAKQNTVTYDVDNNNLAQQSKFMFEKSRRLDRIFVRCQHCLATVFEVSNLPFSDHYPLSAKITF